MPVPKSVVDTSPRRLLRDVVFEKMLAAIEDGTLQPGERLNDDELVQWLGVSRTPIREAIARLVEYGLVDMEANRYTRVATPSREQFDEALQMLFGFTELAARWALPRLSDEDASELTAMLERTEQHAGAEDPRMNDDLREVIAFLVAHAGNPLLSKLAESLIPRTRFLALRDARLLYWEAGHALEPLREAAANRDGDAAGAVLRALGDDMTKHLAAERANADSATEQ